MITPPRRPPLAPQAGMSLLSVVMALGILLVMIAGFMTMFANATRSSVELGQRTDREALRRVLIENLSCLKTLGPVPTRAGTLPAACADPIVIRRSTGDAIVTSGDKLGPWTVVARCDRTAGALVVLATQPGKSDIHGVPLDEHHPRANVLVGGEGFCRHYFGQPAQSEANWWRPGTPCANREFGDCAGAGGRPRWSGLQCPPGQVLVGVRGYEGVTGVSDAVDAVGALCRAVKDVLQD